MRVCLSAGMILMFLYSCNEPAIPLKKGLNRRAEHLEQDSVGHFPKPGSEHPSPDFGKQESALEQELIAAGLQDVQALDSGIRVDLRYAGIHNFLGRNVYGHLRKAYLQPDVAQKVMHAQVLLRKRFPYYSLIIYDAVRPFHIQKLMWDSLRLPPGVKQVYLSAPVIGSLHNYGAAIDVGIVYEDGRELDMGTAFDFFGELAHPEWEDRLVDEGKLSHRQVLNRELLRSVMKESGLQPIETEWWHFNACSRAVASDRYRMIE
jgi:D-alanyl-D-alanine dipeptidase